MKYGIIYINMPSTKGTFIVSLYRSNGQVSCSTKKLHCWRSGWTDDVGNVFDGFKGFINDQRRLYRNGKDWEPCQKIKSCSSGNFSGPAAYITQESKNWESCQKIKSFSSVTFSVTVAYYGIKRSEKLSKDKKLQFCNFFQYLLLIHVFMTL